MERYQTLCSSGEDQFDIDLPDDISASDLLDEYLDFMGNEPLTKMVRMVIRHPVQEVYEQLCKEVLRKPNPIILEVCKAQIYARRKNDLTPI